jgi:cell division protein FtsI/penicillin-binding protein 2
VILILFFAYAFFILITAFRYTVIDHDYYQNLADRQQTIEVKNTVSRGSILSANKPAGVFATSTDLSDLAVDPKESGSKERLASFLSDIVFDELCVKQSPDICYEHLLSFLKQTELPDYIYADAYIREKISGEVTKRVNKEWIDSVIVKEAAPQDMLDTVSSLAFSGIYTSLNNIYADPTRITNPADLAHKLASILNIEERSLTKTLSKRPARYVRILRRLSFAAKEKVDTRIATELTQIKK